MVRRILPGLGLLVLLPLAGCGGGTQEPPQVGRSAGNLAPEVEGVDVNGRTIKLSSYRGQVVLVDFWATWCGPCKIEIPWFIEFQKKYGKDGLQVVGVSVDDTVDKLKPYVANARMNYVVLQGLDHDEVQDAFGPMFGIPVTAIISRDGRICAKHVGLSSKDAFENEIKSLL
jgi:thiol-disulfide isomerase/thioredoxin